MTLSDKIKQVDEVLAALKVALADLKSSQAMWLEPGQQVKAMWLENKATEELLRAKILLKPLV